MSELTPDQRDNLRRTLSFAQDLAHPDWSLSVPDVAKENIRQLLAEIERLRKQRAEALETMEARSAAFDQTSTRMLEEGLLPKSERSPDYDHEVTMRYSHYAAANRTSLTVLQNLLKEES